MSVTGVAVTVGGGGPTGFLPSASQAASAKAAATANEAIGVNVETQQNAILAARELALTPGILAAADGILQESGWPDQNPTDLISAPPEDLQTPPYSADLRDSVPSGSHWIERLLIR